MQYSPAYLEQCEREFNEELAAEICEEDFDPRTLEKHSAQLARRRGIRLPQTPMRRAREPKQLRRIYCRNRQRSRPHRRQRRQPSQAQGRSDDPDPEAGPSTPHSLSVSNSCISQFERAQLLELSWTYGVGDARGKYGKVNVLTRFDRRRRVNCGSFNRIEYRCGGWVTASACHSWISTRKLFERRHGRTRETHADSRLRNNTTWSTSNPARTTGIRISQEDATCELIGRRGSSHVQ